MWIYIYIYIYIYMSVSVYVHDLLKTNTFELIRVILFDIF